MIRSADRVHHRKPVASVINVVGDEKRASVEKNMAMKIIKHIISAEEETGIPEGEGNPRIKIRIGKRRLIIGNDWRTIIVIVIVDDLRIRIRIVAGVRIINLSLGSLPSRRCPRPSRQRPFLDHLDLVPVFFGDAFKAVGEMDDSLSVGIFVNNGVAAARTRGGLGGRSARSEV